MSLGLKLSARAGGPAVSGKWQVSGGFLFLVYIVRFAF
jgi:hypothetical protein